MHTFPKQARLQTSSEFRDVLDHGKKVVTQELVVLCHEMSDELEQGPRLGIIASRKVGNSVERNKVKRCVRESFRHRLPALQAEPKFNNKAIVVIARARATQRSCQDLNKTLGYCFKKLLDLI